MVTLSYSFIYNGSLVVGLKHKRNMDSAPLLCCSSNFYIEIILPHFPKLTQDTKFQVFILLNINVIPTLELCTTIMLVLKV
jgi:hypothetical protein